MDQEGVILDERKLANNDIRSYLEEKVPYQTHAVLEATRNWAFMYDMLCEHLHRVSLAHPKEIKSISHAARKTDRIDARTLAHLTRLKYLPKAYPASKETRDLRLQVRHRQAVIKMRTQTKNRIHAILASFNLVSPVTDLFGTAGQKWLSEQFPALRPAAQQAIHDGLTLIDELDRIVATIEAQIIFTPQPEQVYALC